MPILAGAAAAAALAWAYLLAAHGGYWRTGQRLPPGARDRSRDPARWPSVVAVVPARDEAAILPITLPGLLAQDYPGEFSVVLVDDASTDGTAATAAALAAGTGRRLQVTAAGEPPPGWAGKVHAMAQGLRAAGDCDYVLFTDADIGYAPDALATLVRGAVADDRVLVSQMALLRAESRWERVVVPAFVYFFAQLYPFRRVNRPSARTAAAAGGCMLVRRRRAEGGGRPGPDPRRAHRRRGPRPAAEAPAVRGPHLAGLHHRGAQPAAVSPAGHPLGHDRAQRLHAAAVFAGAAGADPGRPAVAVRAAAGGRRGRAGQLAAAGGAAAGWTAAAGLAGWAGMTASFLPALRLYRLGWWRAPCCRSWRCFTP